MQLMDLLEYLAFISSIASENLRTISTSPAALDEVFRCLLGTGVQIMLARGVARMAYHTAKKHNVVLK